MIQRTAYLQFTKRDVLAQQIVRTLNQMPEPLRRVFMLSHYEARTPEHIAQKMGLGNLQTESLIREANQVFYRTLRFVRGSAQPESDESASRVLGVLAMLR